MESFWEYAKIALIVGAALDEVMGELKTIREEQAVQSHQLSNHEDRIEKTSRTWLYLQISPAFPPTFY